MNKPNDLHELIEKGCSITDLANHYGVTYPAMSQRLRKWGVKVGYPRRSDTAEIIGMYNEGIHPAEIARKKNVTRERIRQILKANGVDTRSQIDERKSSRREFVSDILKRSPYLSISELAVATGIHPSVLRSGDKVKCHPDRLKMQGKAKMWSKIDITADPNECWEWTGTTHLEGYPAVDLSDGRRTKRGQASLWQLLHGKPKGWVVNTCRNKICLNPNHLADLSPKEAINVYR